MVLAFLMELTHIATRYNCQYNNAKIVIFDAFLTESRRVARLRRARAFITALGVLAERIATRLGRA